MPRLSALLLVCALIGASSVQAASFSGMVEIAPPPGGGGGVVTTGQAWSEYSPSLAWNVTNEDTTYAAYPWKYEYTFRVGGTQSGISHFVLETSEAFTASQLFGLSGASISSIGVQEVGSGNPSMPETTYGIRFDPLSAGTYTMTWSFFSNVAPTWGDFYVRGGNKNGSINAAWNAGFTAQDMDPLSVASDGSVDFSILRPDTAMGMVPVPQAVFPGLVLLVVLCGTRIARRTRSH